MTLTKEAALEWLSLVESSGIYLAPKVLEAAFPQSLDSVDTAKRQRLRSAWDEWREAVDGRDPQLTDLHHEWVRMVLTELLEYRDTLLRPVGSDDQVWTQTTFDTGTLVRPDWVLRTGQDQPKVAVFVYSPDRSLDRAGKGAASPIEQVTAWCRAKGVRNALLTEGERWTLVDAPEGAVSGSVTWYARLWWLEPVTLRAFFSLLRARNLFGRQESTFPHLVDASQGYRDEVTTTLGEQVERAVEVLIRALDRANNHKNGKLLEGVGERELYEAGLTVMMRLVFVLSAEERGLLLLGEPVWDANYAVSTLRSQLEEIDDRDGHGVLALRYDAWSRLLAVFRAVYGGIEHESLRLPALGGSLFDPDRFPFLEGRSVGTTWRDTAAEPLPVDNRTVLLLLSALQKLSKRDGAQTLSYRALDVEQIGHIYEGLLERTVARVDDVTLGLKGAGKIRTPDIRLSELESARFDGPERLTEVLKKAGMSETTVRRALAAEVSPELRRALAQASEGDQELHTAVLPFANLLRTDPWDEPVIYRKNAFAVISGSDRSNTGAHYTPKALTERIVGATLEPVAYIGPAEGLPREEWTLKSAAVLLDLKICDPAMGSGAFLVQTCRWLAEKVVQAWANAEEQGQSISAEGEVFLSLVGHDPMTTDLEERLTLARRLVAERCLYGVDINPVAVELAKLSIWLVTLAKNRPFGFLDHNLRHGDSLLGLSDLDQLTALSMKPKPSDQQYIFATNIRKAVEEAMSLRQRLRSIPIRDIRDVQQMAKLDEQARRILKRPELAADALIGEAVRHVEKASDLSMALRVASTEIGRMMDGDMEQEKVVAKRAWEALAVDVPSGKGPRKPMHWPLEFPEVFLRDSRGFDAIVGNPPFLGGKLIASKLGRTYYTYIDTLREVSGESPDLSILFLLRHFAIISQNRCLGIILPKLAKDAGNKKVGLDDIYHKGGVVYNGLSNLEWQGSANVVVIVISIYKGSYSGLFLLDNSRVEFISSGLTEETQIHTYEIPSMKNNRSDGFTILGPDFILEKAEYDSLRVHEDGREKVVFDFITSEDLADLPTVSGRKLAIDFDNMDEDEARGYGEIFKRIENGVKPLRDKQKGQIHQACYWKFWDMRPKLRKAMASGKRFLLMPRVAKYTFLRFFSGRAVLNFQVIGIFYEDYGTFGVLQSVFHETWGREKSTTRGLGGISYSASKALSTFPLPSRNENTLNKIGERYYLLRDSIMQERNIGPTSFYNLINNPDISDDDIVEFRGVVIELDECVKSAYGWHDIPLDHGFWDIQYLPENDQTRYTVSEKARLEILRRLAKLNQERYEEEQAAQQLPSKSKLKAAKTPRASAKAATPASLFDPPPAVGLVPEKPKQAVLEVLRRENRWFKKAEVLRESSVSEREWNLVIAGLVQDGTVERQGEKRGTEYMLKR